MRYLRASWFKFTMNVVISFIGQLPPYIVDCIKQLRLFFKGDVYLIYSDISTEMVHNLSKYNVLLVQYEEVKCDIFDETFAQSDFITAENIPERKFLFHRSYERLFLLNNLMKLYKLSNVWFMECDIMMYVDPSIFLEILQTKPYAYSYHNQDHCSLAIFYARDADSLRDLLQFFVHYRDKELTTEMRTLYSYLCRNPDDFLFPQIYPCDAPAPFHRYYDMFNYMFDGAALGQYNYGVDKVHSNNVITQRSSEKIGLNLNTWLYGELEWHRRNGLLLPYFRTPHGLIPVANLHMHSKNLAAVASDRTSPIEFDIITCIGPNDYALINDLIVNFKTYVNSYKKIYIIATEELLSNCTDETRKSFEFVNETSFPFSKQTVSDMVTLKHRSGWYLQQLLKFYCVRVISGLTENFVIIDSDVVFHKHVEFFQGNNQIMFNFSGEYHLPYFHHMSKLVPNLYKHHPMSGICHLMPMKKHIISKLVETVEKHHNAQFWIRFMELVEPWEESGASEYEILFNYTLKYFPDECVINKLEWYNDIAPADIDPGFYESRHWYRRS
jgi:hypothetical protein